MKNRLFKITIISIVMILFYYLIISKEELECFFLHNIGLACPGCGMTRAFRYIIKFKFIDAFKMNILSIPLFIFMIILLLCLFHDVITNKNLFENTISYIGKKFSILIFILLIISMIVNNFNPLIVG